jgi:hypothetical protein
VRLAAVTMALCASLTACPGPECEEKVDLVDMTGWTLTPPADDPFAPADDAPFCAPEDVRMEPFGNGGPIALDVDTRTGCGWATVEQETKAEIVAGDVVLSRLFYFSQTSFPADVAFVALRFGDEDLWSFEVPIPTSSKLEFPEIALERDVPAGTRVLFHVGNHGDNTWNLLEVSRVRKVFCS